jgi:hypothetical protein
VRGGTIAVLSDSVQYSCGIDLSQRPRTGRFSPVDRVGYLGSLRPDLTVAAAAVSSRRDFARISWKVKRSAIALVSAARRMSQSQIVLRPSLV